VLRVFRGYLSAPTPKQCILSPFLPAIYRVR
jgi:hypothetical protein